MERDVIRLKCLAMRRDREPAQVVADAKVFEG